MAQDIEEGENPNIDKETRARALNFVARQDQLDRLARLADESVDSSRVLETPTEAPASRSMTSTAPVAARPVAAAPKTKPPIITLQQLNAFKKEFGADKDLTDYMNAEAGGLKRRNKVGPDLRNREADAAFARERMKAVAEPTADEIANKQRKEKLNRLKTASAGAESKMRQANALRMSRANSVGGTGMAKGGSVKGYASGGSVSSRADGIAQRGKTRGKMC